MIPPDGVDDQLVVLVDDVLFSGRTVRAALDALGDTRPAARRPARRPGRPRPPRAADPGRLRRQEPADLGARDGPGAARGARRPRRRPARPGRLAETRRRGCGRNAGGPMKRHLLSAADLSRDDALLVLDTAAEMATIGLREVKKLPTLRGRTVVNLFFEDSTRTRISFEAAAKRLSADVINFSREGLERLQGREPEGHRADAGGDGRRRRGDPARLVRRAAPALPSGSTAASSTPATAPTSTPPRLCSTRSPCAATSATSRAGGSPSSATSCTAGWPAPTSCCCTRSAPRSPWSRRRRCCRSASSRGRARHSYDLDAVLPKTDVVMMLRVQRERMNAAYFPSAREYSPPLRPRRARGWARCPTTRSSCTPAR